MGLLKQVTGKWTLVVMDSAGKIVHSIKGKGVIPPSFTWNGYAKKRFVIDPEKKIQRKLLARYCLF